MKPVGFRYEVTTTFIVISPSVCTGNVSLTFHRWPLWCRWKWLRTTTTVSFVELRLRQIDFGHIVTVWVVVVLVVVCSCSRETNSYNVTHPLWVDKCAHSTADADLLQVYVQCAIRVLRRLGAKQRVHKSRRHIIRMPTSRRRNKTKIFTLLRMANSSPIYRRPPTPFPQIPDPSLANQCQIIHDACEAEASGPEPRQGPGLPSTIFLQRKYLQGSLWGGEGAAIAFKPQGLREPWSATVANSIIQLISLLLGLPITFKLGNTAVTLACIRACNTAACTQFQY